MNPKPDAPRDPCPSVPTALRADGARTWHCEFTSGALRVLAQNQPDLVARCLARDPAGLVAFAMARAAEPAGLGEAQWRACAAAVKIRPATLLPDAWLLEMPVPIAAHEAHFAVLLARAGRIDYFTLDRTAEGDAVLRRWDLLRGPRDVARACPPDVDALEDAILRHDGWTGAAACAAIARAATQHPADARSGAAVDSGDITRDNLSRDRLLALLEAAYMDVTPQGDRALLVPESGVRCLVTVPADHAAHVTLAAAWSIRKDVPREARLEAANRLNSSYLAVRGCIDSEGDIVVDLQVLLPSGISRKYFVLVLKRFALIARDAVTDSFDGLLA